MSRKRELHWPDDFNPHEVDLPSFCEVRTLEEKFVLFIVGGVVFLQELDETNEEGVRILYKSGVRSSTQIIFQKVNRFVSEAHSLHVDDLTIRGDSNFTVITKNPVTYLP